MVKYKQPLKTASSLPTDLSLKHQGMCCWSTNRWDFNFEDWIQTSGLKFKNVKSTMLSYQSWLKHKLTQNKLFHIYKQTKNYNNYIFVVVSHNKNKTNLKKLLSVSLQLSGGLITWVHFVLLSSFASLSPSLWKHGIAAYLPCVGLCSSMNPAWINLMFWRVGVAVSYRTVVNRAKVRRYFQTLAGFYLLKYWFRIIFNQKSYGLQL